MVLKVGGSGGAVLWDTRSHSGLSVDAMGPIKGKICEERRPVNNHSHTCNPVVFKMGGY